MVRETKILIILFTAVIFNETWCCPNFEKYRSGLRFTRDKHVAALILARGGSTGVSLKNVAKISNHTLLGISLQALKNCTCFSSIWVSTDHQIIAEEAEKHEANIHWRSPETATNEATSLLAVQEFISKHSYVDVLALIQCTSPFIKTKFIEKASELIRTHECVFSVTSCAIVEIPQYEDLEIDTYFDLKVANLLWNILK